MIIWIINLRKIVMPQNIDPDCNESDFTITTLQTSRGMFRNGRAELLLQIIFAEQTAAAAAAAGHCTAAGGYCDAQRSTKLFIDNFLLGLYQYILYEHNETEFLLCSLF